MFKDGKIKKALKKLMNDEPALVSDEMIIEYIVDKKKAAAVLEQEDYDAFLEVYDAYCLRNELEDMDSYDYFVERAAEIAYTIDDFIDVYEVFTEKDPELLDEVSAYLDDYKIWQKKVYSTYLSTVKSLVKIANKEDTEKSEEYSDAAMFSLASTFLGLVVAVAINGYRDSDIDGYYDIKESVTRDNISDALFWKSLRAFEAKMSSLIKDKFPGFSEESVMDKMDAIFNEFSIVMGGSVSTSTKLVKIAEAYLYNCGVKKPTDEMLDVIESLIVFIKYYPNDELAIVDFSFKKLFGSYSHPITKQPICSAQDYLDAIATQATGNSIVTDTDLSLEEIDSEYAKNYGATVNPVSGKPISSAADFIEAYKAQRGIY